MRCENVDFIGVPVDLGVKELGLKLGPDAFREAGLFAVARQRGLCFRDIGNIDLPASVSCSASAEYLRTSAHNVGLIADYCERLSRVVADSVERERTPVCLGGDHSLAIGCLAGVALAGCRAGCLWIDAHPDANTPETSPSGNVHGMPVAIITGFGPSLLVNIGKPGPKVDVKNICLLGVHDIDPGEADFVNHHRIRMFTLFDVIEQGLANTVRECLRTVTDQTDGVHVSLDLDSLHETVAPGVGLPSPYGFNMREAAYICHQIASHCRVVSIDLVGLNPVLDHNLQTARRGIELLMTLLGYPFSFR
jgi:arginase